MDTRLQHISRVITHALRHRPQALALSLDKAGWVDVLQLLAGLSNHGHELTLAELQTIVALNDKRRFAFSADSSKIRANQGHSVPVDLGLKSVPPPLVLYHGTHVGALQTILKTGIKKQSRHDVHLSTSPQSASTVGQRHGKPVVLVIDCKRMYADGYRFRVSANGVWLTEEVPPKYLTLASQKKIEVGAH
jgi:putative RNA 2'-phosphotransferase